MEDLAGTTHSFLFFNFWYLSLPQKHHELKHVSHRRRKALVNRATAEPLTICTRPLDLPSQDGNCQSPQQPRSSTTQPSSTPKPSKVTFNTAKHVPPPKAPSQVLLPSIASPIAITCTQRTSSPLSPSRTTTILPGRPVFPRSKQEPHQHRWR
jgi:hypothetical protein